MTVTKPLHRELPAASHEPDLSFSDYNRLYLRQAGFCKQARGCLACPRAHTATVSLGLAPNMIYNIYRSSRRESVYRYAKRDTKFENV